jgi:hypothetical protein
MTNVEPIVYCSKETLIFLCACSDPCLVACWIDVRAAEEGCSQFLMGNSYQQGPSLVTYTNTLNEIKIVRKETVQQQMNLNKRK